MSTPPDIVVVMAVFEPDECLLSGQIASIAGQEGVTVRLVAVAADLVSGPLVERLAGRHELAVDLVQPESRLSSYEAFEEGLTTALNRYPRAGFFALADQDDVWRAEKLALSASALAETGTCLVHTDAEVVAPDGSLIAPSLHRFERRLMPRHARDLLIENAVTGMTLLATRKVIEAAVPFPRQAAVYFHHDLWLALVAEALDGLSTLDMPLVAYRQHPRNVVGAGRSRKTTAPVFSAAWRRHWGGTYYVAAYLAKSLYLRMEGVEAAGATGVDRKSLARLKPYLSEHGLGLAHIVDALRCAGRGRRDLAFHSLMFTAVRCARAALSVRDTLFRGFLPALAEFDRKAFARAPGAQPAGVTASETRSRPARSASSFSDTRRRLDLPVTIDTARPAGVTLFVPSLNPTEIFAGIATALDVGLGLAERGHPVTFVATDLPIANRHATESFLTRRAQGGGARVRPQLVCAKTSGSLTLSPAETLIATAWWTAHICDALRREGGVRADGFYYLVQDYEPGFYPWGDEYAGALSSYDLGARPVFNSVPLARHFSDGGLAAGDDALIFHPAIDIARYAGLPRAGGRGRRLAYYGRPEVARNLFPTGIEAIERFLSKAGLAPGDIDLVSVGMQHEDILFASGHRLKSLGKIPWGDYPRFLTGVDVGLSLMLSPHPSHPPLEMAAAGARVVTNDFAGKCLADLTPAIRSVAPDAGALSDALCEAWAAGPVTRRERSFDLTSLGRPLPDIIDALDREIRRASSRSRAPQGLRLTA